MKKQYVTIERKLNKKTNLPVKSLVIAILNSQGELMVIEPLGNSVTRVGDTVYAVDAIIFQDEKHALMVNKLMWHKDYEVFRYYQE